MNTTYSRSPAIEITRAPLVNLIVGLSDDSLQALQREGGQFFVDRDQFAWLSSPAPSSAEQGNEGFASRAFPPRPRGDWAAPGVLRGQLLRRVSEVAIAI